MGRRNYYHWTDLDYAFWVRTGYHDGEEYFAEMRKKPDFDCAGTIKFINDTYDEIYRDWEFEQGRFVSAGDDEIPEGFR